jgi:hypothetical protein
MGHACVSGAPRPGALAGQGALCVRARRVGAVAGTVPLGESAGGAVTRPVLWAGCSSLRVEDRYNDGGCRAQRDQHEQQRLPRDLPAASSHISGCPGVPCHAGVVFRTPSVRYGASNPSVARLVCGAPSRETHHVRSRNAMLDAAASKARPAGFGLDIRVDRSRSGRARQRRVARALATLMSRVEEGRWAASVVRRFSDDMPGYSRLGRRVCMGVSTHHGRCGAAAAAAAAALPPPLRDHTETVCWRCIPTEDGPCRRRRRPPVERGAGPMGGTAHFGWCVGRLRCSGPRCSEVLSVSIRFSDRRFS